jgi:molybdopterin-containing oxidoreductase family iron-sulfur binding subunit
MKTIPPSCPEPETGLKYWRSLDQLADTPEFHQWVEREFPAGASEFSDPVSRRHFVKIMSASFLLAGMGLAGCRRPAEKILPFGKAPEGYIHGVPQFFATAMPDRGGAIPLVARSNDGRPTKVEGNSLHPDSNGGTDRFAQASILNLYDVDRAMRFTKRGDTASRDVALDFLGQLSKEASANGGQGLGFLLDRSSSPSRHRLQQRMSKKLPKARWFTYEAVDFDVHRQAVSVAFGKPATPYFRLDQAKVILSLDSDFIGSEGDAYRLIRGFSQRRKIQKPDDSLNRLYVVEGLMTLTGANADHRLRVAPGAIVQVAAQIAGEVFAQNGAAGAGEIGFALTRLGQAGSVKPEWVGQCARDLLAHKGESIVLAGYGQPLAVHLLAWAINAALGNVGKTVQLLDIDEPASENISELAKALDAGQLETLVVIGGNPVYDAPADLNWSRTQRKAKTVVRLGYCEDETFALSDWHLPLAHYLESWGDARTSDGTLVPIQPLIEPLFGGMTELEVLARIGGEAKANPYDLVRDTFKELSSGGVFEENWKKFLHDGFLANSTAKPVEARFDWSAAAKIIGAALPPSAPAKDKLEVVFHRDYKVDDGRYNNNGWLQELPDPITKMVWENVILMSWKTAHDLGLAIVDKENNNLQVPLVKITVDGREVEGPAWIQPGMADHVIGLALGYGRTYSESCRGRIGKGAGYNAYRVRSSAAPYLATGAKLTSVGKLHKLATTQNHWAMEGRPIIREANLEQYRQHPDFAKGMNMHEPPGAIGPDGKSTPTGPLYPNPLDIPGKDGKTPRDRAVHAWGMSIDLNACVGCSACMMACQSENNIPIVGKDQVSRNRELHWIRIDRYYTGSIEDPQVVNQPMLCQHCESAPCESVCPVNATIHDEEGLNVMAYNRCVGTRYCSNNCPYKVRRFNYFDYNRRPLELLNGPVYTSPLTHRVDGEWEMARWWRNPDKGIRPDDEWELLKLVKNPDVTVRMRGVMEKCTFCLQRIEGAKITQKVKAGPSGDVEVPDGTIKTACQQACPAEAIVFGNLKDPESRVSQLKKQERDYTVLEFLLTKPRLTYLARVRNPNPEMPDYKERGGKPESFREWENQGNTLGDHENSGGGHGTEAAHGGAKKGEH